MRAERVNDTSLSVAASWPYPRAGNTTDAVPTVSEVSPSAPKLGRENEELLAKRRGQRLEETSEIVDQVHGILASVRNVSDGEDEESRVNRERLLSSAAGLVVSLLESSQGEKYLVFPPLPSPLAAMRTALRAYSDQGATGVGPELMNSPKTSHALSHSAEVLIGPDGVVKRLGELKESGASSGAIGSSLDELTSRLDNLRDQLRVARETEVDRVRDSAGASGATLSLTA